MMRVSSKRTSKKSQLKLFLTAISIVITGYFPQPAKALVIGGITYSDTLPLTTSAPKTTAYVFGLQLITNNYLYLGTWSNITNACLALRDSFCPQGTLLGNHLLTVPYEQSYACNITTIPANECSYGDAIVETYCPDPYAAYSQSATSFRDT